MRGAVGAEVSMSRRPLSDYVGPYSPPRPLAFPLPAGIIVLGVFSYS
jgi:hypothetical protein